MISRIRLEAFGRTVEECHADLKRAASLLDGVNGNGPTARGELVIERSLEEPDGSRFAFRGRHILHPDVSEPPDLSVPGLVAAELGIAGTNP